MMLVFCLHFFISIFFILVRSIKRPSKLNARQQKRLRKRLAEESQIHPPMILPSPQYGYSQFQTASKIPKILPSSSVKIFKQYHRDDNLFSIPCFENRSMIIVTDSIGKYFSSRLLPDRGVSFTSLSGGDLLELSLLLSYGQLNHSNESRPILMTKRKHFGLYGEAMPSTDTCKHCQKDCFSNFSGTFVTNVALNNSLKGERKSYKGQSIKRLYEIFESLIRQKCPNLKRIIYIRPIRPVNEEWRHSKISNDLFDQILKVLSKKTFVIGDPYYAIDHQGHVEDGIHMDRVSSESYFRKIMSEIREIE